MKSGRPKAGRTNAGRRPAFVRSVGGRPACGWRAGGWLSYCPTGRRPAGLLARPIPSIFDGNPARNFRRDQQSAQNHLKIMHTSAKHYFEVVWAHMGACRAVGSRFWVIFGAFSRFWTPRPTPLAPSRPNRSQAVPGRGFGGFYKELKKSRRIL